EVEVQVGHDRGLSVHVEGLVLVLVEGDGPVDDGRTDLGHRAGGQLGGLILPDDRGAQADVGQVAREGQPVGRVLSLALRVTLSPAVEAGDGHRADAQVLHLGTPPVQAGHPRRVLDLHVTNGGGHLRTAVPEGALGLQVDLVDLEASRRARVGGGDVLHQLVILAQVVPGPGGELDDGTDRVAVLVGEGRLQIEARVAPQAHVVVLAALEPELLLHRAADGEGGGGGSRQRQSEDHDCAEYDSQLLHLGTSPLAASSAWFVWECDGCSETASVAGTMAASGERGPESPCFLTTCSLAASGAATGTARPLLRPPASRGRKLPDTLDKLSKILPTSSAAARVRTLALSSLPFDSLRSPPAHFRPATSSTAGVERSAPHLVILRPLAYPFSSFLPLLGGIGNGEGLSEGQRAARARRAPNTKRAFPWGNALGAVGRMRPRRRLPPSRDRRGTSSPSGSRPAPAGRPGRCWPGRSGPRRTGRPG